MRLHVLGAIVGVAFLAGCTAAQPTSIGDLSTRTALPTPHRAPTPSSSLPSTTSAFRPQVTLASFDQPSDTMTVGGYVAGVIEDGGQCLFSITGPGAPVELTTVGAANATTTSCGSTQTTTVGWSKGTWHVTLTYRSGDRTATSAPADAEIVR